MAARTVADIIQGKTVGVDDYQKKWKRTIGKQLKVSNFLANLMFNSEDNMELVIQMAASDRHPLKGIRILV